LPGLVPHSIFRRAIERGDLTVPEVTLRTEIAHPSLVDLLDLTGLIAQRTDSRFENWIALGEDGHL